MVENRWQEWNQAVQEDFMCAAVKWEWCSYCVEIRCQDTTRKDCEHLACPSNLGISENLVITCSYELCIKVFNNPNCQSKHWITVTPKIGDSIFCQSLLVPHFYSSPSSLLFLSVALYIILNFGTLWNWSWSNRSGRLHPRVNTDKFQLDWRQGTLQSSYLILYVFCEVSGLLCPLHPSIL
jgi:hypothetical protein